MGMYDILWVDCPKCGEKVDFQSKGGECMLLDYTIRDVPPEVLGYVDGDHAWCKCGAELILQVQCNVHVHVTNKGTSSNG